MDDQKQFEPARLTWQPWLAGFIVGALLGYCYAEFRGAIACALIGTLLGIVTSALNRTAGMRFQFSIPTMLLWTSVLGVTLYFCLLMPSLKHDVSYLMGMLPEAKRMPGPDFDEVVGRFALLAPVAIFFTKIALDLVRAVVTFAKYLWRGKRSGPIPEISQHPLS